MRLFKLMFIISCIFLLNQCSVFSPAPYQTLNTYELSAACPSMNCPKINKNIYVAPMQAYPGLNTSSMRYTQKTYEVNYFTKNRWVAPPTTMMQPLLVTHLQQHFSKVTATPSPQTDVILKTTLVQFQQAFQGAQSQFHLCMKVEIINAKTNRVITIKTINVMVPACIATPYGGVVAANKATAFALKNITALLGASRL